MDCSSAKYYSSDGICTTGWDVAQAVEHSPAKVVIIRLSLHGMCICSLGYFPFQPVVHKRSIKGCGMCGPVCGKVHIKDPVLLIGKHSNRRFCLKKCHNDHMLDMKINVL